MKWWKRFKTETVTITPDSAEAQEYSWHREGRNDYKNEGFQIVRIKDRKRRSVKPVWSEEWTEISPGIESRAEPGQRCVRIFKRACPVRVLFRHWFEYVSYTDSSHCSSWSRHYWVKYKAGKAVG